MFRSVLIIVLLFNFISSLISPVLGSEPDQASRISVVVQKMEDAYKEVKDYTCVVEQFFYRENEEDRHFRFKYYFKKQQKIRVDFLQPYSELTLIYRGEGDKVTVMPIRFLPVFKVRVSINYPAIKTPSGQRINQTDMGFFIEFLSKNLKQVPQEEDEFYESGDQIGFVFRGMDYVEARSLEKYRIHVSKQHWLPVRLERYDITGKLLEISIIQDYVINSNLEDKLFEP